MKTRNKIILAATVVFLLVTGCVARVEPVQTRSETVELNGASSVDVDLEMGAGELSITGDAEALMNAEFVYNVTSWAPEVSYEVNDGVGTLRVLQPEIGQFRWPQDYEYAWHIDLNNDVPVALEVNLGAGTSLLDLASLQLTGLDVDMGAGQVTIDLAANWERDIPVSISGGVGELTVRLPSQMGVRATLNGGLGNVDVQGLQQEGDAYVNDAYGRSEATLSLSIEGGVGQVHLAVVGE